MECGLTSLTQPPVAREAIAEELKCPICTSGQVDHWARAKDVEYYTSLDRFNYYRCDACDVLFLHPLPMGRLSEIYPSNYYSYAQAKSALIHRLKSFLDRHHLRSLLTRIPGSDLRVLDIGGGTGQVLDQVRAADPRVKFTQIIDLDERAEQAARAAGHDYVRGRIEETSALGEFDLILMLNLIEHVEDPVKVLAKAGSLLKASGKILIKTPNFDSLDARWFRHRAWGGYHCPRHWTLFTARSFRQAVDSAGLVTDRISFTQGAPFWAISVFEMLRSGGLVSASRDRPAPFHPIIPLLQAIFAAFDFARAPFAQTSQMFVEVRRG